MPELPDVEVFKRCLDRHGLGRTVSEVHAPAPEILRDTTPQGLGRRLHGERLAESRRHGKYLFARYRPKDWLVLHFGMTGRLVPLAVSDEVPEYTDLELVFEDGSRLAYVAPRKLGLVGTTADPATFAVEQRLGPDALALDRRRFAELATGRRVAVKCWLMDQSVMAGIGNVYSDEALFQAGIHPKIPVAALGDQELGRLHDALTRVLETAIDAGADPQRMPSGFLLPRREPDAACPRCGTTIVRVRACGRAAYFCPGCQGPRPE